jgi:EAL domain-containing protein (putative c-di-GMP-specific phosphodiesterase class I)
VLRDADIALYRAKSLGRARHQVFDTAMHAQAVSLLQTETDLRRAIERDELRLVYQPIVSLETGRITGFEALLRWQHPERGLLHPAEFVSIAEETGLIVPIGTWVLREACRQLRRWQEEHPMDPPLTIHVNLSGKQFAHPNLVKDIAHILHDTALDGRSLILEITESVLMSDAESAVDMCHRLKNMGVQLCIDDFGTGYSSLSYLHRFPTDALKIDRSFVTHIGTREENLELVRIIVALARNLGMDAIPEGVETPAHLAHLRALGCGVAQGYLFSQPIEAEAAAGLLRAAGPS